MAEAEKVVAAPVTKECPAIKLFDHESIWQKPVGDFKNRLTV